MNWSEKSALVTGAGGFIGSHLVERLVSLGCRTRAFVRYNSTGSRGRLEHSELRDECEVHFGDIRDRESVFDACEGIDLVFHLAALIGIPYSYHAPVSYIRTNIEGTHNVLQAALDLRVERVVHTSTSEVYGTAEFVPINEAHPLKAQSPYAASKIGADKIAEAYHRSFELPVVTIRPFNTYGPRQSARAIIPTIAVQALSQPVVRLGNLDSIRDFNFVEDTVDAFVMAGSSVEAIGEVVNVGSGVGLSIRQVAAAVLELVGSDVSIIQEDHRFRPDASEVEKLVADNSRAKELLSWSPRFSFEKGLIATISWIRTNLHLYRAEEYSI